MFERKLISILSAGQSRRLRRHSILTPIPPKILEASICAGWIAPNPAASPSVQTATLRSTAVDDWPWAPAPVISIMVVIAVSFIASFEPSLTCLYAIPRCAATDRDGHEAFDRFCPVAPIMSLRFTRDI